MKGWSLTLAQEYCLLLFVCFAWKWNIVLKEREWGSEEWDKLIKKLGDPLSWLGIISKRKRIFNINAFKARLLLPIYFLIWWLSLFVSFTRIQLANRSQNPNAHTNLSVILIYFSNAYNIHFFIQSFLTSTFHWISQQIW